MFNAKIGKSDRRRAQVDLHPFRSDAMTNCKFEMNETDSIQSTRSIDYSARSIYAPLHRPFYHIVESAFVEENGDKGKDYLRIAITNQTASILLPCWPCLRIRCEFVVLYVARSVEGSRESDEQVFWRR